MMPCQNTPAILTRLAILVVVGSIITEANAITFTWDGGAGTTSWHDAANWNPNAVPNTGADVVISVPGSLATITFSTGTADIARLICDDRLFISGGSLSISSEGTIRSLRLGVATLGGSGLITVTERFDYDSGLLTGSGVLMVTAGALMEIEANGITLGRRLENHGACTWQQGDIYFQDAAAVFANYGSFIIEPTVTATMQMWGNNNGGRFDNYGLFRKSGSITAGLALSNQADFVRFNNHGTLEVLQGIWACTGGSHSGTFSVANVSGALLSFFGNTPFTFAASSMISGPGRVDFFLSQSGSLVCDGVVDLDGAVTMRGPQLIFNNDFRCGNSVNLSSDYTNVEFNGRQTQMDQLVSPNNSNRMTMNSPVTELGVFTFGGELFGSGDIRVQQQMSWGGTMMPSDGCFTVEAGATITLSASSSFVPRRLSRRFENYGTAELYGSISNGTLLQLDGGRFENHGTVNFLSGGFNHSKFERSPLGGIVQNTGIWNQDGGTLEFTALNGGTDYENTGLHQVTAGRTWFNGGGFNHGDMVVNAGATLMLGSTLQHDPSSTITGSGRCDMLGGTHVLGTYTCTGALLIEGATVTLNNSCAPSGLVVVRSPLTLNADQSWHSMNLLGAMVSGPGNLTLSSLLLLQGRMAGSGKTTVSAGGTLDILDNEPPIIARTVECFGSTSLRAATLDLDGGQLICHGPATNSTFYPLQIVKSIGGPCEVSIESTFMKTGSGTFRFLGDDFPLTLRIDGALEVESGNVELACTVEGAGTVHSHPTGSLTVKNVIQIGSVQNEGVLQVEAPGRVECGKFFSTGFVRLLSLVTGLDAPLTCGTEAVVNGALLASSQAPFAVGDTIPLLECNAVQGMFTSVSLNPYGTLDESKSGLAWRALKPGDINGDLFVGVQDLLIVIGAWGQCPPGVCLPDLSPPGGDQVVNVADLLFVIASWGS